jgi:hypothetical protein
MRDSFKVLITNSINILGIFLSTYLYFVIYSLLCNSNASYTILFGALFSVILYGMLFWAIFFAGIFILDLILICNRKFNLRWMLLLEWLLISSPFIYWMILYREWVFLVAIITFLITQLFREHKIRKI